MAETKLIHAQTNIDNRCVDLLLTESEILDGFRRALDINNRQYFDQDKLCKEWPVAKPKDCALWRKILGLCITCNCEGNNGQKG